MQKNPLTKNVLQRIARPGPTSISAVARLRRPLCQLPFTRVAPAMTAKSAGSHENASQRYWFLRMIRCLPRRHELHALLCAWRALACAKPLPTAMRLTGPLDGNFASHLCARASKIQNPEPSLTHPNNRIIWAMAGLHKRIRY